MSVERMLNGLHGSVTALVTPFRGSRVDEDALGHLVERQILRGTAALVACGSTGEAATLSRPRARAWWPALWRRPAGGCR